uniref:Uncharacterized protein n=1 Tax=Arundo donax TaxID=35708 RepID=A0A0A8Z1C2_ARUDO
MTLAHAECHPAQLLNTNYTPCSNGNTPCSNGHNPLWPVRTLLGGTNCITLLG